jgi:hypothetical protein
MRFRFEYGPLDDGTFWVLPPSNVLFHINALTLRIVLELNSGANVQFTQRKYELSEEELLAVLDKFAAERAIVELREGRISVRNKKEDIWLTPYVLFFAALGIIQIEYFKIFARTYLMRTFGDALSVGLVAIAVVFFHELGHYLASRRHFKPRVGFTFLSIFPAIYVDTQLAWCLPRNTRILINGAGLLADMLVNAAAISLVLLYPPAEYFVTPFLMLQFTRLTVVLNPLFSGDGYWLLADMTDTVNLNKKGIENLLHLRPSLYSVFGLFSIAVTVVSAAGFVWYLFNLLWRFLVYVKLYAPYILSYIPS